MALRSRHGKAARVGPGGPVVEVRPLGEQRKGLAAPAAEPSGPVARRADGTVSGSEAARELGKRGGRARAERQAMARRFASSLRLAPDLPAFALSAHAAPFVAEAERWLQAKIAELAARVGGGEVGAGVVSILRTAAYETYASRLLFELATGRLLFATEGEGEARRITGVNTQLFAQAARLGDAARQNLLAAHELCRLETLAAAEQDANGSTWPWSLPAKKEPTT
jgi:hypothetical protein